MTLYEIQEASQTVGDDLARWEKWKACGRHNPNNLTRPTDTRHYYCPACGTIWAPDGTCVNHPRPPQKSAPNAA